MAHQFEHEKYLAKSAQSIRLAEDTHFINFLTKGAKFVPQASAAPLEKTMTWDAATLNDVLTRLRRCEEMISAFILAGGLNVTTGGNDGRVESKVPGE